MRPETDWPRWPRRFHKVLGSHVLEFVFVALILFGFLLRSRALLWTGVAGIGLMLSAGIVYALVMGAWTPIHTVRNWKSLPVSGRIVMSLVSLLILVLLGSIVAAGVLILR